MPGLTTGDYAARVIELWMKIQSGCWTETKALLRPDGETLPVRRIMHRLEGAGLAELKYVSTGPGNRKKLLIRVKDDWKERLWL